MPALVTEDWAAYEFVRGERARRHFIITGVLNALEAENELLNQKGVAQSSGHDLDSRLVAQQPVISHPKGPNYWEADVVWLPIEYNQPGGGSPSLDQPIRWSWRSAPREESTDVDAKGRPLLNTAAAPWQSDFTRPFNGRFLIARRNESIYRSGVADEFENTVNSNRISVSRIGIFEPGRLKLVTYEPDIEYTSIDTNPIPCTYTFEVRAGQKKDADGLWDGFKFRIRNEGFMGWYASTKQGKFLNSEGEAVSEPVLLDRTGKPIYSDIKVESTRGTANAPSPCPFADFLIPDELVEESVNGVIFLKYPKCAAMNFNGLALFTA